MQDEIIETIGSYEIKIPRVFRGLQYKRTIGKGTFAVVILWSFVELFVSLTVFSRIKSSQTASPIYA